MRADEYLQLAEEMLKREIGRPRQTSLKRAVSTGYYALFHAVLHACVEETIGWSFRSPLYWETISPLYRAIDHSAAKRVFSAARRSADASPQMQEIAKTFVTMQDERIRADYDPSPTLSRADAHLLLEQTKWAIATLATLGQSERRWLVANLLSKQR